MTKKCFSWLDLGRMMGQGIKKNVISERTDSKIKTRDVIRKVWGDGDA